MQIAKSLAGFSGAKADDLRKAIGKKNREAMASCKPEFFEGCRASGTDESVIEHAVGDQREGGRLLLQQVARRLLRADLLPDGVAAGQLPGRVHGGADLLGDVTKDKVPFFVAQAEQMGIEILPPDVNLSDHEFMVVDGNIRFGLDAVKGVGYAAVEAIKAAREGEGGPFTSLWDFCERVDARCGQQEGDRGADQVRRVRLDRRHAAGACSTCSRPRRRRAPKTQLDAQIGQSLDLRPRWRGDTAAAARARPSPRTRRIPTHEFDRQEHARAGEGVRRPVHLRAPAEGGAGGAAGEGRLRAAPTSPSRKDGEWVKIGGMVVGGEEDPHARRLDDDVRDDRRPRGRRSRCACSRRRSPPPRARWTRTRSSRSAAASTSWRPARSA